MSNHDLTATSEAFEGPVVRTCIGCRARDEQRNLLRIARTPVTSATEQADTPPYQPDVAGTMPGRGAWIHPSEKCVAALQKKNGLARAFKKAVPAAQLQACCEQIRAVIADSTPS
ncbi:YlxR family protein [Rothia mucilaginosa]|uniref:YlxR family protein n=1 Tax=Rothia mucilaginosa TaxID=43675 RepID=UPI0028E8CBDF|nr:YlxR family protein [Rothia mucilaginosa]